MALDFGSARARGCPPPSELSRVVERRPGVMPPKPGPPPRNVSRKRVRARRLGAIAVLLVILATGIGIALAAGGSGSKTTAPTTIGVVLEHQFRVIFPEGFTPRQMASRAHALARIAHSERGDRPS